ncbi:MAG TPA: trehalose-phosphatase [Bryobacterales bacterium]|nr:trehalose-phosphatase [Bryobacterales bacterium]
MANQRMQCNGRHLFDCWPEIAERLRRARHVALFLDFDGTLAPLRADPEEVTVRDPMQVVLRRLARHRRITVAVISGRRRADLRKRLNVRGVRCFGLHGWESGEQKPLSRAQQDALRQVRHRLAGRLAALGCIRLEDKTFTLAVHDRCGSRHAARRLRAILRSTLAPFAAHLRLLQGHRIWEVLPREIRGKGAAARALLPQLPPGTLPLYAGDDATDESAFRALARGVTVCVGKRQATRARYRLRSPIEVRRFLEKLEAAVAS